MARRYHYDRNGRLKGFTTDKYIPRLRDIAFIAILAAIFSPIFGQLSDGSSERPEAAALNVPDADLRSTSSTEAAPSTPPSRDRTNEASNQVFDQPERQTDPIQTQNDARAPIDGDETMEAYYAQECAKGDLAACDLQDGRIDGTQAPAE